MLKKLIITSLVLLYGSSVNAGLIVEGYGSGASPSTLGGYEMFDFILDSSDSPNNPLTLNGTIDGDATVIELQSSVAITHGNAVDFSWWNNHVDDGNYDIFNVSGTNYIDIILPENTVAFSFNVGANFNGSGWITATDNNLLGLTNNNGNNGRHNFSLSSSITPGYGIYADQSNGGGECTTIGSIRVDPVNIWGIGNFSINTGGCATVPEPSILALFAAGLFGIGFVRRRIA